VDSEIVRPIIFDEIHKLKLWKLFLKGFYDVHPNQANILVTGSARLDVYQREVDFLVTKDDVPYIMVEVKKNGSKGLSPHLIYFQEQLKAPYALQVALDAEYVDANCFAHSRPLIVPAKTFLSQLV